MRSLCKDHPYPGIRFILEASLDKMRQTIRINISTDDIITPGAAEYSYNLMFEERAISIWTYNLETLLAEKLETIMVRGTANTRMRDFYDIHACVACSRLKEPCTAEPAEDDFLCFLFVGVYFVLQGLFLIWLEHLFNDWIHRLAPYRIKVCSMR